jgi:hypothetical protein
MAMAGNDLGDKIALAITSPLAPPETQAAVKELWKKIGTAIVDYIKENAEVSTTGGPSAQTGTIT